MNTTIEKLAKVLKCEPEEVYNKVLELLGQSDISFCEVTGCSELAEYEGWWKVRDGFGILTGLIQRRCVCREHASLLEGDLPEDN